MNWYKKAQINGGKVKYLDSGEVAILGKTQNLMRDLGEFLT